MKNIEKVNEIYGPKIIETLASIKKTLDEAGYVTDEPAEGFSDTDYPYVLTAWNAGRPDDKVYIDFSIVDAQEFDGIKGHLNFELKVQVNGGQTPFSCMPGNYTENCWVRASDDAAVHQRFVLTREAVANATQSAVEQLLKFK